MALSLLTSTLTPWLQSPPAFFTPSLKVHLLPVSKSIIRIKKLLLYPNTFEMKVSWLFPDSPNSTTLKTTRKYPMIVWMMGEAIYPQKRHRIIPEITVQCLEQCWLLKWIFLKGEFAPYQNGSKVMCFSISIIVGGLVPEPLQPKSAREEVMTGDKTLSLDYPWPCCFCEHT